MAMTRTKSLTQSYDELKWRYFAELSHPHFYKGDVRAFFGLRIWHHERDFLKDGCLSHEAHVMALEKALGEILIANENTFHRLFDSTLDDWRECQKVWPDEFEPHLWPDHSLQIEPTDLGEGLSVISLFSGALGLDLGFHNNGFKVCVANDIEPAAAEVARFNLPDLPFLCCDINDTTPNEILRKAGLKRGKVDVLIGGPPCQPFSTAGKRQGFNDVRSSPIIAFLAAIKEMQPQMFVMEEVTGLLSSRLEHVPEVERDEQNLTTEQEHGSAFRWLVSQMDETGYDYTYSVLNAANFGAPQTRNRIVFIGTKRGTASLPNPTHGFEREQDLFNDNSNLKPWNTFWEATANLVELGACGKYAKGLIPRMKLVPPGGYWRHLPKQDIPAAMGGAVDAAGGKMGFYRRLAWDEPSPTVVTSPAQKGTVFGHPYEQRPLSVAEFKRLQGFPDTWNIPGASAVQYKLIGNAVSVHMSSAIARHVARILKGHKK
jgi:DNA (cytosine-5)-methyltransferase 1